MARFVNKSRWFPVGKPFSLLLRLIVIASVICLTVLPVQAAIWVTTSQGNCPGGAVIGDSWLYWDGYFWYSYGESMGWLWYWSGGSWVNMSSGYGDYRGSPGNALAHTQAEASTGTWNETGAHKSNFFSGQVNSYSSNFTCP